MDEHGYFRIVGRLKVCFKLMWVPAHALTKSSPVDSGLRSICLGSRVSPTTSYQSRNTYPERKVIKKYFICIQLTKGCTGQQTN